MSRSDFVRHEPTVTFHPDPDREGMERAVIFEPGYSDPGPRGSDWCGKHGMGIRFILRGKNGAMQFLMNTGWVPGEKGTLGDYYPSAWDYGHHARYRGSEWESARDCEYLHTGTCYYDGSSLHADTVMKRFITEGESAVWDELAEGYAQLPSEGAHMEPTP